MAKKTWLDITLPGKKIERGHLHPLTLIQKKAVDIFTSMGFELVDGPELETEYYNFDALNLPKHHPSRDLMDTFWTRDRRLMRTHTSPVQVRYMETHQPPTRIIVPGRVFRYEATDAHHEIQFYQLEGLMVGRKVTLANLKAVMEVFFQKLFDSKDVKIRLRPSYFPFVEPGVEVDMKISQKSRAKVQKIEEWIEIAGAGMIHPKVLENAKINPREWQGFAFGMGIDRLTMLKYKIDDIRLFYSGDLRFISQF